MDLFFSILFTIVAIVFIFFLAWFLTRFVATRGGMLLQGKNIRVVEKVAVSKECFLMVVETFGRYSLVGVTPQGMTVLRELAEEEAAAIPTPQPKPVGQSFAEIFRDALDTTLPEGKVRSAVEKLLHRKGDGHEDQQGR